MALTGTSCLAAVIARDRAVAEVTLFDGFCGVSDALGLAWSEVTDRLAQIAGGRKGVGQGVGDHDIGRFRGAVIGDGDGPAGFFAELDALRAFFNNIQFWLARKEIEAERIVHRDGRAYLVIAFAGRLDSDVDVLALALAHGREAPVGITACERSCRVGRLKLNTRRDGFRQADVVYIVESVDRNAVFERATDRGSFEHAFSDLDLICAHNHIRATAWSGRDRFTRLTDDRSWRADGSITVIDSLPLSLCRSRLSRSRVATINWSRSGLTASKGERENAQCRE